MLSLGAVAENVNRKRRNWRKRGRHPAFARNLMELSDGMTETARENHPAKQDGSDLDIRKIQVYHENIESTPPQGLRPGHRAAQKMKQGNSPRTCRQKRQVGRSLSEKPERSKKGSAMICGAFFIFGFFCGKGGISKKFRGFRWKNIKLARITFSPKNERKIWAI